MDDKTRRRPPGDMKAGLTSGARPKLSILPRHGLVHGTRGIEYGADKYARGNYYGPAPAELGEGDVAAAKRLLGYIDATVRHLTRTADALNRALGTGDNIAAAAAIADEIASGNFPASGLPDLSHAISSILIGVTCAVDDGLLPEDPGQPWAAELAAMTATASEALAQKDDPAAERRRVADRRADQKYRESMDIPYSKAKQVPECLAAITEPPILTGRRFKTAQEGMQFAFENSGAFSKFTMNDVRTMILIRVGPSVSRPAPTRVPGPGVKRGAS